MRRRVPSGTLSSAKRPSAPVVVVRRGDSRLISTPATGVPSVSLTRPRSVCTWRCAVIGAARPNASSRARPSHRTGFRSIIGDTPVYLRRRRRTIPEMPLTDQEYLAQDATGLAALVRRGEIAPADLVETAIGRIERLNPRVNAVIHRMDDAARQSARAGAQGPFAGVPLLLKDLVSTVAGEPFRCGSRFLRGVVPPHDSELVLRSRKAGLLSLGKTNHPAPRPPPFT